MYGFGLLPVRDTFTEVINFMLLGAFFYVIFEVIATFSYSTILKFVPNFEINQKDFKYYLRLVIIARNTRSITMERSKQSSLLFNLLCTIVPP